MATQAKITFGLVHGAWHGSWCWDFVKAELQSAGHDVITPDLPIEDAGANFDDYADIVVAQVEGKENLVLAGHSRAGNVIPRVANRLGPAAVKSLIYICASFEDSTVANLRDDNDGMPPPKRTDEKAYMRGLQLLDEEGSMTRFNPEDAFQLFYQDCPRDIREWAVRKLRPQRAPRGETVVEKWPAVPQHYILAREDRIMNPEWSRYACRNWLKIKPIEIDGGHSPFLCRPNQLAGYLIMLAEANTG